MNLANVFGHGNRHVATANKPRISKAHGASPQPVSTSVALPSCS
jgi:hypothetical protein